MLTVHPVANVKLNYAPKQVSNRLCAFIVVDQLDLLSNCLESVRPWVDAICVVGSGSAGTAKEIHAACAGYGAQFCQSHFRDDRSAMLNVALSRTEYGWGVFLLSSEFIPANVQSRLRTLVASSDGKDSLGYEFEIAKHGQNSRTEVRLFPRHNTVRFLGHSIPQIANNSTNPFRQRISSGFSIEQHEQGSLSNRAYLQIEHEILLLHLDLCKEPKSIFVRTQLAQCYGYLNATEMVDRYTRRSRPMRLQQESAAREQRSPQVVLMRGLPGCGKSTRAKQLAGESGVICESDAYWNKLLASQTSSDKVVSAMLLGAARRLSREYFIDCIDNGVPLVVVDRGNGLDSETYFYARYASENGYQVSVCYPQSPLWIETEELLRNRRQNQSALIAHARHLSTLSKSSGADATTMYVDMMTRWIVDLSVDDILAWEHDQQCE